MTPDPSAVPLTVWLGGPAAVLPDYLGVLVVTLATFAALALLSLGILIGIRR